MLSCGSSQILRITFPFFDIENSASCNFDFLQVHDGESASAHTIGKYCGTAAPAELFSSHNSLYFWFRSDHSVSGRGFTVAWQSQAPGKPRMPLMCSHISYISQTKSAKPSVLSIV